NRRYKFAVAVKERTWERYRTSLGRLQKRGRVWSGLHPDPGGLFPVGERVGEKLSGKLRIVRLSVPSVELNRTSSYLLSRPLPLLETIGHATAAVQIRGTAK